jgi:geranylgeranyl diphosphate synthase type II
LNLSANEVAYGKEIAGDLVEGKRTLIVLHMMRSACPSDQEEARRILAKAPHDKTPTELAFLRHLIERHESLRYASEFAARTAEKASAALDQSTCA